MSWISQHKLVFIVIIIVIVAGLWYGLSQGGTPAPVLSTTSASGSVSSKSSPADQELVGTLLTLRAVTLSGTIFSEQAFITLQDFGTTIVSEPIGRDNPFAPLTVLATTTSESQHAAQIFAPRK
ncbi:MAG: hypothetical protein JWM46_824 [Candidatus Kaiserbacteria bacterium]|nr:hypothetical protein [Candidatus Kaiserbacteria bacterium]